jgi:predicted small secreted protein
MKKAWLIIALLLLASSAANANALGGVIGNI